jgi:hypothetical protein
MGAVMPSFFPVGNGYGNGYGYETIEKSRGRR